MKRIVVCSGKGGTGKSCVAAYTGAALAAAGKKVLLVELERTRSLEAILGVKEAAFGALDVFAGGCEVNSAIVQVSDGLALLPCGDADQPHDDQPLRTLLEKLETAGEYDFIIIDGAQASWLPVDLCDSFLLVATPDTLSVRAAGATARQLYRAGAKDIRLVINNVPARIIPIDGAKDFDDIIDAIGARLISVIPSSPKLAFCANNAQPLDPDSLTLKVFENLAGRLMGKRIPLLIR